MEKVLASNQFCNSRRYPALLRYVVDQALSGNGDQIKERTVGIEVFGRPPDYDTNTDTVVRYTAGEVRKRLALFYQAAPNAPVQISLSARSYLREQMDYRGRRTVTSPMRVTRYSYLLMMPSCVTPCVSRETKSSYCCFAWLLEHPLSSAFYGPGKNIAPSR